MILKSLARSIATGAAAAAVAGAVTAGLTSASWDVTAGSPQVQPMVFGVPMPLDTPGDIPSTDDLYSVLNGLANPNVPFSLKGHLVEDGIGNLEGRAADALMRKAVARGLLPLSFQITDIATLGNGVASANVTASGPGMAPTTENITFVDHGGWKLSSGSAAQVMQMFSA